MNEARKAKKVEGFLLKTVEGYTIYPSDKYSIKFGHISKENTFGIGKLISWDHDKIKKIADTMEVGEIRCLY